MTKEFYTGHSDLKLDVENAYKEAMKRSDKYTMREEDFTDLYSSDEIKKDVGYVEEHEALFEKQLSPDAIFQKKRAAILEYILFEQSQLGEWFGKYALALKTSKYDDIKNGIDMVTEFSEGTGDAPQRTYLGLAIDISFSAEPGKKFDRIRKEIAAGQLGEVKYFKSPNSKSAHKLSDLPRVVLDLDSKTVTELTELWLNGKKEDLANHPAQLQIIHEIVKQLKTFETYARIVTKNEQIADKYKEVSEVLRPLRVEKDAKFPNHQGNLFDSGYEHIVNGLSQFERDIQNASPQKNDAERKRDLLKRFPYLNKNKNRA